MIFPWPAKPERQRAIAQARLERELSQAGAQHAEVIQQQLRRMADANHFAARIAEQIMRDAR
jgi:hypothetical protein